MQMTNRARRAEEAFSIVRAKKRRANSSRKGTPGQCERWGQTRGPISRSGALKVIREGESHTMRTTYNVRMRRFDYPQSDNRVANAIIRLDRTGLC
jgi:hypothetical protein